MHRSDPPCIVLGVESQIGLAIVRELGHAGVRVVAVSHTPNALGLASRHVWRRVVAGPPRSEALLDQIKALGREFGRAALFTVSEPNIEWLNEKRAQLGPLFPVFPDSAVMRMVLDKSRTLAAAQAVGIDVPRSAQPVSLAEVDDLATRFPLPAVAKWPDPNQVMAALEQAGIELGKAEYLETPEALRSWGRKYQAMGRWPMLQQYGPGHGLGQFFFMRGGQAVRRFQHLRVAEWPPEGGASSVCDGVPLERHRELQERSIALLRSIGWEGVAMVEYRWDPATDRTLLMEINGRFWGSLPLAMHSGAGFALLSYRAALGLPMGDLPPPRQDLRCRMVTSEIKRLVRILFAPERIRDPRFKVRRGAELARFLADFLSPRVRYYLWSADDPAPFWADVRNALLRR